MVKLFLNQLGVTVFGTVLTIATKDNSTLLLLSGLLSIGLYLYLNYTVCWEIGAKDKIRVDGGRLKYSPAKGFIISLGANIPNILFALLIGFGILVNTTWGGNLSLVSYAILHLLNGMYNGIMKLLFDSVSAHLWWGYIVATLPSIIICGLAYFLGSKNIRILKKLGISKPSSGKNQK